MLGGSQVDGKPVANRMAYKPSSLKNQESITGKQVPNNENRH